jgi:N-acetyl-S-(2-succino)cysteine monooxygenase
MNADRANLVLGLSMVSNGTHLSGWRHPDARADSGLDFKFWTEMARRAEAAKIHFMFWADGAAVRISAKDDDALSFNGRIEQFEPTTLIAALSAVTEKIGLVVTASTTYNEPYNLARRFASIDHISGGRAGWNVVTSWSEAEAKNFSRDKHMEHATRYQRAGEFMDIVDKLWNSWEDDAFVRDKASGRYFDPEKMHVANHKGEFFQVQGPLNIERPVQGRPVIAQAGQSEPGQELAARTADIVYTAQQSLEEAQAFYASVKGRTERYGRRPEDLVVMPGGLVILGRTDEEAQEKLATLENLVHPKIAMQVLQRIIGADLSEYPVDGPIPEFEVTSRMSSHAPALLKQARDNGLTIRQLYSKLSGGSGHHQLVGTASTIADHIEHWYRNDACDGFNFLIPYYPQGLYDALDQVVPELQRRGIFRTEYRGSTLRDNLGLRRPAHPAGGR